MIVLRTPKGWTGPDDRRRPAGRGHVARAPGAARRDAREPGAPGRARALDAELPPRGAVRRRRPPGRGDPRARPARRQAHGLEPARQRRPAPARSRRCPTSATSASTCLRPARRSSEATRVLGEYLRDVMQRSADARNFRLVGPDETVSNRLGAVLEETGRAWMGERSPLDEGLAADGRVMEILSEHVCQGWLEGYLLTGRHGLFSCYEAFIHIVDSMFNQHAKWLKVTRGIPWRQPIASLNYLLTSHVWRQDHNGFSHQDPGLHRPRREQEGRGHPRLPAARRELPALGRRPLPAQPQLRQRDRRRQAAGAELAHDRAGRRPLRARARRLGLGVLGGRAAIPTSSWRAPATCRRSRRSPR